ncbi:MAG: ATP-binding protein [Planctomycetota bacterium]|nr:MAG: ATP-binding protein [Planctomycetota bacterium]
MLTRWVTEKLEEALRRTPAVALIGPRQVGKTTLALAVAKRRKAVYLDLENPGDLLKLSDPLAFLDRHRDKLVILDEIQRAPDLFMVLRGLIDKNRREGRIGEQYLLLGSASVDLLRQSSESLAGRIHYFEITGFNALEVQSQEPTDLQTLWFRGGFPESYLSASDALAMEWQENFIRTYLERDVPQMGFRIPSARLRRLWTMLAHLQGETVNSSKLAANLEVGGKTVSYYLDILVDLLLVRRLMSWNANVKKQIVKSPHFYIRDSGLLHRLLGIRDFESLLSNPVLGKSWEGFVIENILSILPSQAEAFFYRTAAGAEIDLLLKLPGPETWSVEIKRGAAPKLSRGFHTASEDVEATQKYLIYGGADEFPIKQETTVISLERFMNKVQQMGI